MTTWKELIQLGWKGALAKWLSGEDTTLRPLVSFESPDGVFKFGYQGDVDTGDVPEDIIDAGGLQPWPTAEATTTIVSDSVQDTTLGTGARRVYIQGVDDDDVEITTYADMDGTSAVTLDTDFKNVHRAWVTLAGSNEKNVGNIQVLHGATVLAQITAGEGQTLMAAYTVPTIDRNGVVVTKAYLSRWHASVTQTRNIMATMTLYQRPPGGAWRVVDKDGMSDASPIDKEYHFRPGFDPGTQLRVTCTWIELNNGKISSDFQLEFE